MSARTDPAVLIVGAGPTGLMLANQLARRGVPLRLVDRHSGPARETRALGVQARTLEIYARLGVVERALERGTRGTGANLWATGRRTARIPLGEAGAAVTPYPFIHILGQDDNEAILGDRLRELGQDIQWRTELVALEQDAQGVVATLKQPDGTLRRLVVAWVAGCDGARSSVRTLCGVGFPGAAYEHVFFVADVVATGTMVPGEVNAYLWRSGFHLFFPMRGTDHWRLVGILPRPLRGREDLGFDDVVPSLRGEAGSSLDFRSCSWFSTYRIHHRSAERFRAGRCFLLGDAAHIHSPVGAQGMNTGLQDAYNLGWKLALVAAGRADAALLDSYAAERQPVARRLLATTDRAFRLIVSDSPLAGLLRTRVIARVVAAAMRRPAIQGFAFRAVSQTGIHYRRSALSQSLDGLPAHGSRPGDRFPWLRLRLAPGGPVEDLFERLDDRRFTLLVFGQPAPDLGTLGLDDLLAVHAVPTDAHNDAELRRVGLRQPSAWLLRPDGHIGLCAAHIDAPRLTAYLHNRLHLPVSPAS